VSRIGLNQGPAHRPVGSGAKAGGGGEGATAGRRLFDGMRQWGYGARTVR